MSGKATRLYPLPAREIPARAIYEDLELPPSGWRDPSRPYVMINTVASVDGKTAVGGKAAPLGSETDRRTMRNLRSKADAVMIGAGTLRAERLSLGLDAARGGRQPLAVIVTAGADVPLESNLALCEGQKLLLITAPRAPVRRIPGGNGRVLAVPARGDGNVDLQRALELLKAEHDVNLLLVEGGPTLNGFLVSDDLVDELFLTLAPKLLGGRAPDEAPTMLHGPELPSGGRTVSLVSAHLCGQELFLRYRLQPPA